MGGIVAIWIPALAMPFWLASMWCVIKDTENASKDE